MRYKGFSEKVYSKMLQDSEYLAYTYLVQTTFVCIYGFTKQSALIQSRKISLKVLKEKIFK